MLLHYVWATSLLIFIILLLFLNAILKLKGVPIFWPKKILWCAQLLLQYRTPVSMNILAGVGIVPRSLCIYYYWHEYNRWYAIIMLNLYWIMKNSKWRASGRLRLFSSTMATYFYTKIPLQQTSSLLLNFSRDGGREQILPTYQLHFLHNI